MNFIDSLKEISNYTYTENGAIAYKSTGNKVLDAFGSLGSMKNSSVEDILNTFYNSFYEDRELSMKLLFYIRDIRGGQGMRRVFRIICTSLACTHPEYVIGNLDNFLFFGRGDDYMCLVGTPCENSMISEISKILSEDLKSVKNGGSCSLLAKWLPSENTSSKDTRRLATKIRTSLDFSSKQYRQMLSLLRKEIGIVESKMSQDRWDEIDFEKLPSRAAMIYSDAFYRHRAEDYTNYLINLSQGKSKVNSKSLFPVDIVRRIYGKGTSEISKKDEILLDSMWKALPNYFSNTDETGICCVDTSGSMRGEPILVSLSLGLYCADKCKGPFKNHFITFDHKPVLQEIKGDTVVEKIRSFKLINPLNTDFEACLRIILDTAIKYNLKQEDLPSKLYVISDMQFDVARGEHVTSSYYSNLRKDYKPFMQKMKELYSNHGYTLPAIVYWNVRASQCGMFHQTFEGEDCCVVSGYSPSLFKSVVEGTQWEEVEIVNNTTGEISVSLKQKIDPIEVMKTTLNNERYDRVYTGGE